MSDQDKIFRLIKVVEILLESVDRQLSNDWKFQTHVVANERRVVEKFLKAADAYESMVELYKTFMVEWRRFNLNLLFFKPSIPYPVIISPQARVKTAIKLIRIAAREIRKDVDYSPDILSVIKMDNGGNRFYDRYGRMISEIHQGQWPNDRFTPGAEIVMSRYMYTHEQAKQWKEDLEVWLMREHSGCTGEIKQRIGARPL